MAKKVNGMCPYYNYSTNDDNSIHCISRKEEKIKTFDKGIKRDRHFRVHCGYEHCSCKNFKLLRMGEK